MNKKNEKENEKDTAKWMAARIREAFNPKEIEAIKRELEAEEEDAKVNDD